MKKQSCSDWFIVLSNGQQYEYENNIVRYMLLLDHGGPKGDSFWSLPEQSMLEDHGKYPWPPSDGLWIWEGTIFEDAEKTAAADGPWPFMFTGTYRRLHQDELKRLVDTGTVRP